MRDMKKVVNTSNLAESSATNCDECQTNPRPRTSSRSDVFLFIIGIIFIFALLLAIFISGWLRGWDALSGYSHNVSVTSAQRFLPEPFKPDPYCHLPGRNDSDVATWYYWKNKPDDVTMSSRLFVWLSYAGHQISAWSVIYMAQLDKIQKSETKYTTNTNKYNWMFLGLNIFFHVLHLVQTHTTYDGLAQDVHITSSQSSVTMIFCLIMVIEYSERGVMFGWPVARHTGSVSAKLKLNMAPVYLMRKYHGYAIAWGSVYTFWYHPMENTYGHALGFMFTWLLLLQGSLMHTRLHLNKWWRLLLEVWLVIHGGLVAFQTGGPSLNGTSLWPMFVFGSLLAFSFSWIFILDFWKQIPSWTRVIPVLVFFVVSVASYSAIPDVNGKYFFRLQETIRIPSIFYLGFIFSWALIYVALLIEKKLVTEKRTRPSVFKQVIFTSLFLMTYSLFIGVSAYIELQLVPVNFFVGMIGLTFVFVFGASLSVVFISQTMPPKFVKAECDPGDKE